MRYSYLIIVLLIFSCTEVTPVKKISSSAFFDLPSFFEAEITALGKKGGVKTTSVNGKGETVNVSELMLERELQLFIDSDINKMAWVDKYEQATREEKGFQVTTYKAVEESLVTQVLEVFKMNGKAQTIYIRKKLSSKILNTEQELTYRSGIGYLIQVNQTDGLITGNKYKVDVKFIN